VAALKELLHIIVCPGALRCDAHCSTSLG
jgi:hypothetical protein